MSTISNRPNHIPVPVLPQATQTAPQARPHMVEKFGGDPKASGLPCPMLSVLVNEGRLKPDATGSVSVDEMKAALKSVGISNTARLLLAHGGASATEGSFFSKSINLLKLQGSSLDHKGSLGPLQDGGFNPQYLAQLKSFARNGTGITLEDLAVAEKVRMQQEGGGARDYAIGYAELAAFIMIFGKTNAAGEKELRLKDLDTIYKDNKFPKDFDVRDINMVNLTWTIMKLAVTQNSSSAAARASKGLREAFGENPRLDNTSMLSLGAMCPAGMRPKGGAGATGGDIQKLHQSLQAGQAGQTGQTEQSAQKAE